MFSGLEVRRELLERKERKLVNLPKTLALLKPPTNSSESKAGNLGAGEKRRAIDVLPPTALSQSSDWPYSRSLLPRCDPSARYGRMCLKSPVTCLIGSRRQLKTEEKALSIEKYTTVYLPFCFGWGDASGTAVAALAPSAYLSCLGVRHGTPGCSIMAHPDPCCSPSWRSNRSLQSAA